MDPHRWSSVVGAIRVCKRPGLPYVSLPTDDTFDRFEAEWNFSLPESYRAFAKSFGAGELGEGHRFLVPYCPNSTFDLCDRLARHREGLRNPRLTVGLDDCLNQLQRFVMFFNTFRGESFGWDPQDAQGDEFGVYLLPRVLQAPDKVAADFLEFVGEVLLGDRYHEIYQQGDDEVGEEFDKMRRSFVPAIGAE